MLLGCARRGHVLFQPLHERAPRRHDPQLHAQKRRAAAAPLVRGAACVLREDEVRDNRAIGAAA